MQDTACEQRQLRQGFGVFVGVVAHLFDDGARADLGFHPGFEDGFGGRPQVELGVEAAAQAFDVEEGFLQEDELRLDVHVKAARGLEEADEEGAEGDFFDGFAEDGFADFADGSFEVGHAGIARHPARLDV